MRTNYDRWFGNPERAAASVSRIIDWYETQLHGQHRQFPVTDALGWDSDEIVMERLPIAGHKSLADTNDTKQPCRPTQSGHDDDIKRHAEQGTEHDRQDGTTLPIPTNTLLHQGSMLAWMNAPSDERKTAGTSRDARKRTAENDIADRERRYWLASQNAAMHKAICRHADGMADGTTARPSRRHDEPELLAALCEDGWFDLKTMDDPGQWSWKIDDIIHSVERPDEPGRIASVWERDGIALGIRDCITHDRIEIAIEGTALWNKFYDAACSITLPRTGITDREYRTTLETIRNITRLTARERNKAIEDMRARRFDTTPRGRQDARHTQRCPQRNVRGRAR